MTKIAQLIVTTILGIALLFLIYILVSRYIKYQAVDKCLEAGKTQFNRDNQNLSGPDGFWYKFCMKEKGLTVQSQ